MGRLTVQTMPQESIKMQEASFNALLQSLDQASFDEVKSLMDEREEVEPEAGLTPEIVHKLQQKIAAR